MTLESQCITAPDMGGASAIEPEFARYGIQRGLEAILPYDGFTQSVQAWPPRNSADESGSVVHAFSAQAALYPDTRECSEEMPLFAA